ncbi:MAG: hypothetical protein QW828_04865 [Candidatus Bathyarchaeia archaeon]
MRKIESGEAGVTRILTSDYVVDEAVTAIFARTGSLELTKRFGDAVVESKAIERLSVDEETFIQSWEFFKRMGRI